MLSPSLSAPEPRYYAYYKYDHGEDGDDVQGSSPGSVRGGTAGTGVGKRVSKTTDDMLPIGWLSSARPTMMAYDNGQT